ncbi:hypothetical protein Bsp3421_000332 (plasmid) [Burkholderia sp. FERM BP-3421]|uniref:hypothetical protein n=1 Tax=Burkholderia sp. FERM BP-3421 TaxID=1494466 RepID=UPI00235DE67F|nr:hypothetical protein [Burkholderia sp. FERM BP-3421]WDD90485.1 hypothetical protein Bsp3421_000332 [Burkholderia sp. FERM BP-3421]
MNGSNGLELGVAANLVKGYASGWDPSAGTLDILHRPAEQPMVPQPLSPSGARGNWSYPVITLHDTPDNLVTELLGYSIDAPAIDQAPPRLPTGALLLSSPGGSLARSRLAAALGVSLDNPDLRYALVKLTRADQVFSHTTKEHGILTTVDALSPDRRIGVNSEFMRSMARLRHFRTSDAEQAAAELTLEDANAYLKGFARWGTHFVSSITGGDQIVQVFAYEADRFERVRTAFEADGNDFTGIDACDFQYFTTDANKGAFGFVRQYGKILCFSNARVFQESLAAGEWVEKTWAKQNSVFQVFAIGTAVSRRRLNAEFTNQVPVAVTLAPLTTFTEYKRTTVWRHVFKAAMSCVFADAIDPNFVSHDATDFNVLIPEEQPGVISAIATPTINIYKARLNLAGMQLVARADVRKFISFGYVVSGTSPSAIDLPGTAVHVYGYILDMRANGRPNVVSLSDKGFDGLAIGCDRFLGVARFQNAEGRKHFLVADGLRYELDADGWPSVTGDVRHPPPASGLHALKDSLEFSLAFGETVLGMQTVETLNDPTRLLARDYLKWVGKLIPADCADTDLQTMRFRALDLSSYAPNTGGGAFVPILPAADYQQAVGNILDCLQEIQRQVSESTIQINQRKQAELTIDVARTLNENIVQSGELLSGLIKANAQSARDLSGQYDAVISARQAEARAQQTKINELSKAVFEQQAEVDRAVQGYQAALAQWETLELVKFGLEVATSTFSLSSAVLVPSTSISAVKDLGQTAQRIQKTLNVLNATMKVYTTASGAAKSIQDAQTTLDGLDGLDYGNTSALNWDEMSIQLDVALSTGPGGSVTAAKARLVAAFKLLALRGKALVGAQSSLHQIQREIYTTQRQKLLNDRQTERLDDLTRTLHPARIRDLDREAIDLVGLTGSLDYLRRQMLTTFTKSFLLQDQALQYAWLQKPTPIASHSLLTFMQARIAQSEATLEAKSQLLKYQAGTTSPISIDIEGVLVEDICDGNAFEIIIDPNSLPFRQYVNLRVQAVVAEVQGVKSTDSGKVLLKLTFEDKPFIDRNVERATLRFHTPFRERVYQFDVATGQPDFSDQGRSWSTNVSPVTPFGSWLVSLPKTQTNQGLRFSGLTVTIRLTFVLEARIVDVPVALRGHALRSPGADGAVAMLAASGAERWSADQLIAKLNAAGATTNGWDVVFNMGLSQINKSLRDQYDALAKESKYKHQISVRTEYEVMEGTTGIKKFDFTYGYPLLEFQSNNPNTVLLKMQIEDGTLTKCKREDDQPEKCGQPVSIKGKTLMAVVTLSLTEGVVFVDGSNQNILHVELNMAKGAFSADDIELIDEEEVSFSRAIKAHFQNNPIVYRINALNITNVPVLEALRPNGFRFKLLTTPAGVDLLQLFIQTGSRKLPNATQTFLNHVDEPLPLGSEASLFIRSDLFFSEILPQSLDRRASGWSLVGRKGPESVKASWCEFTNAPVFATDVKLGSVTDTQVSPGPDPTGISVTVTTYALPNDTINWNLAGMTLTPRPDGQMLLSGTKAQSMAINTYVSSSAFIGTIPGKTFTNEATSSVYAMAQVKVEGSGRDQTIKCVMESQAVTVTGGAEGGGPSNTPDLQYRINEKIRDQVPKQIVKQLDVSFAAVSLFAIKNLLFPTNNYITFTKSAAPGDMLVLGNFSGGAPVIPDKASH